MLTLKNAKNPRTTIVGLLIAVIAALVGFGVLDEQTGNTLTQNLPATVTFVTSLIGAVVLIFGSKDG